MGRYTIALVYGTVSTVVGFCLVALVIAQGKHWYTAPLGFSIWGLWYGSLFLLRCPQCRRSVFARGVFPAGALPVKQCTKCGTDLTVKDDAGPSDT